jgi:hypothetical protein
MEFVKTFDGFLNESGVNEAKLQGNEWKLWVDIEEMVNELKSKYSGKVAKGKIKEFILDYTSDLNESELNEGKNFGDMTASIGGGKPAKFAVFFKAAKNGDTFEYAPNGVELDFIANKSQVSQGEIDLEIKQTSRDAKPVTCTVWAKRKNVILNGGGMDYDRDAVDAIYFTIGNDKNTYYVLTNTFE